MENGVESSGQARLRELEGGLSLERSSAAEVGDPRS